MVNYLELKNLVGNFIVIPSFYLKKMGKSGIAGLCSIISLGYQTKKQKVKCERSNYAERLLNLFWNIGIICGYKKFDKKFLEILLNPNIKYNFGMRFIKLGAISVANKQIFKKKKQLFEYQNKNMLFVTTPMGVFLNSSAYKLNLGGKLLGFFLIKK